MSIVAKVSKISIWGFCFLAFLAVAVVIYLYVNMDAIAKGFVEQNASRALGVAVIIDDMDINLEERKVVVTGVSIANLDGYTKPQMIKIDNIVVAGESFDKDLIVLSRIEVNATNVNLEVRPEGTNLGDIKKIADANSQGTASSSPKAEQKPKVIIRNVSLKNAQLNPSITLVGKDLAFISVPDIYVTGIGEKENGVAPQEAVAQVMAVVLQEFNKSANSAGFLEGLSLDVMNDIGVSTLDVFNKNLKKAYEEEVKGFGEGINQIKGLFTEEKAQ